MLERSLQQPDRIVGELLQPGGYAALQEMGLQACVEGIDAQQVCGYALFKGSVALNMRYPATAGQYHVAGRSFHHGRHATPLPLSYLRASACAQ